MLAGGAATGRSDQFRVHEERQPCPSQFGHRGPQVALIRVWKLVDARWAEKRLEPRDSRAGEGPDLPADARHDAPVEAAIDPQLAARSLELLLQSFCRCGHGRAVQRHVEKCRDSSGGRSPRGRLETLPLGAAWFIDVHVSIDKPRQDNSVRSVFDRTRRRDLARRDHRNNLFARNEHRRVDHASPRDDAFAPQRPDGRAAG